MSRCQTLLDEAARFVAIGDNKASRFVYSASTMGLVCPNPFFGGQGSALEAQATAPCRPDYQSAPNVLPSLGSIACPHVATDTLEPITLTLPSPNPTTMPPTLKACRR